MKTPRVNSKNIRNIFSFQNRNFKEQFTNNKNEIPKSLKPWWNWGCKIIFRNGTWGGIKFCHQFVRGYWGTHDFFRFNAANKGKNNEIECDIIPLFPYFYKLWGLWTIHGFLSGSHVKSFALRQWGKRCSLPN